LSYLLIDEGRLRASQLAGPANLAALLFRIETSRSPEELSRVAEQLAVLLPPGEEPELRRAFTDFLVWALRRALPGVTMPKIGELEEIAMIEDNMDRWREGVLRQGRREGRMEGRREGRQQGRQEGRREGRQEGRMEGERRLLVRQMEWRFGPLPRWVRQRVREISSLPELERLGKRLLQATTLEEMALGESPRR
jgi:uncharacterized protein DUF4351